MSLNLSHPLSKTQRMGQKPLKGHPKHNVSPPPPPTKFNPHPTPNMGAHTSNKTVSCYYPLIFILFSKPFLIDKDMKAPIKITLTIKWHATKEDTRKRLPNTLFSLDKRSCLLPRTCCVYLLIPILKCFFCPSTGLLYVLYLLLQWFTMFFQIHVYRWHSPWNQLYALSYLHFIDERAIS